MKKLYIILIILISFVNNSYTIIDSNIDDVKILYENAKQQLDLLESTPINWSKINKTIDSYSIIELKEELKNYIKKYDDELIKSLKYQIKYYEEIVDYNEIIINDNIENITRNKYTVKFDFKKNSYNLGLPKIPLQFLIGFNLTQEYSFKNEKIDLILGPSVSLFVFEKVLLGFTFPTVQVYDVLDIKFGYNINFKIKL